jgi:hypothetical protein
LDVAALHRQWLIPHRDTYAAFKAGNAFLCRANRHTVSYQ